VHRSTLTVQDTIFSTRFHYKIKRKHGKFEKCKVRFVVQGCTLVGFERSMWTVVKEGHVIEITVHIDNTLMILLQLALTEGFWMNSERHCFSALKERMKERCTPTWGVRFLENSKPARHFYRENIMLKTYCAPMAIGTVSRSSHL
jgi:hypothetical protein